MFLSIALTAVTYSMGMILMAMLMNETNEGKFIRWRVAVTLIFWPIAVLICSILGTWDHFRERD